MAKRKKHTPLSAPSDPKTLGRASRESEARFPAHLSPIMQCKASVLDRARIEFYAAIIIGAVEVLLPMSVVTRSIVLLFVFGPLVDITWRSPWSHALKVFVKVWITVVLVSGYVAIVTALVVREHKPAALALEEYMKSGRGEWLIRLMYAIAAAIATYIAMKAWKVVRTYIETSRAEELATKQKFYDATPKGWLDYRLESEKSSKHLHFLVARLFRRVKALARFMKLFPWFVNKDDKRPPADRARVAAFFIAIACDVYTRKIEPEVKDMEGTAEIFMKSTEGYLKTLSIISKNDFMQLANLREYFECQLKDIREVANALAPLSPALEGVRGHSRESTAAINRLLSVIKAQTITLRRVEGHCARMVKQTEANFDRSLLKATKPLLESLVEIIRLMKGDEGIKEYHRLLKEKGLELPSRFA